MRQAESGFYQLLRRNIPGFWSRIENVAGVGIPDSLRTYEGLSGLVELKVSIGNFTYFKTSQLAWCTEYHKAGKRVAVITRDEDRIIVNSSLDAMNAPRTVIPAKKQFKVETVHLVNLGITVESKPFNWKKIQQAMEEIHRVSDVNYS